MILVAYASKHGATEGIARFIAERFTQLGRPAEAHRVDTIEDLAGADAVVLGSALYVGSWTKEATAFASRWTEELSRLPVWLFSSGPLGTEVDDEHEQPRELDTLTASLHPRGHVVFFGALDRDSLGIGERLMVKAVKAPFGDFRDWDAITAWVDDIDRSLLFNAGAHRSVDPGVAGP